MKRNKVTTKWVTLDKRKKSTPLKSTIKALKLKLTKKGRKNLRRQQQQQQSKFTSKNVSSSHRLLITKNKRKKLHKKKQTVVLQRKITKPTINRMSPPNYYAKLPDTPHPPPPPIHGAPLPQSPDFQLCQPCNKIYRKEHFTLHQQAYHPLPADNPEDPSPDTKCPLCPSASKTTNFENVRLLFFHFLKLHLPSNLHNYFSQADKVRPLIIKPKLPLNLEVTKKKGGRPKKGQGDVDKVVGVTCPECGKALAGDLKRHMAQMHDKGERSMISYACPLENCAVKSNSTAGLRKHLYEGHLNLWREKIGRWFGGGELGGEHLKCGICGWRGGDKWECLVHFILGHGNKLEEGEGEMEGNLNSVRCPICGEAGGDGEVMRRHMKWIHGGELGGWRCPLGEDCGGRVVINREDFEKHWGEMHGCKMGYLLRKQGKLIRGLKVAGKVGELFENRVCVVKVERVNLISN